MALSQKPMLWLSIGFAIHLLFVVALFGDWLRPLFNDASHTRRGFDFGVFYLAGQALLQHQDIYTYPSLLRQWAFYTPSSRRFPRTIYT